MAEEYQHNGIVRGHAVWQPDFEATASPDGSVEATHSFRCHIDDAQDLLASVANCAEPGYAHLTLSGATIRNIEGMVAEVSCSFGGAGEGTEYDPDDPETWRKVIVLAVSPSDIPILEHEKFRAYNGDPTWAPVISAAKSGNVRLDRLSGSSPGDDPRYAVLVLGSGTTASGITVTQGDVGYELIKRLSRGQSKYRYNAQKLTISYTSKDLPGTVTTINPEGTPTSKGLGPRPSRADAGKIALDAWLPHYARTNPDDREWMFDGLSIKDDGAKFEIKESYTLSGPGGWDPYIYDEAAQPED